MLTAASLMVTAPAAADAIRRARTLPQLRVGLHLVLADGVPALPPSQLPALVSAQGRFDSRMASAGVRWFAVPAARAQLEAEIRAQFAAFAASGLTLDHVNAHKHFHLHPTILGVMLRVAREYGSPPVRLPREPLWFAREVAGAGAVLGALPLTPWLALMRRRLRRAGVRHNDYVFGIAASGAMSESVLLRILARLPEGVTEIYLHPGTQSGEVIARSMRGYRHADELAALLSLRVRAALAAAAVPCSGFREALWA